MMIMRYGSHVKFSFTEVALDAFLFSLVSSAKMHIVTSYFNLA